MASTRPVLFRIPFSHYCQKAEWGMTQAGLPYDCVDIPLAKMERLPEVTPTGLVPAMLVDGTLIQGSDAILEWADAHAAEGTLPLFPVGHAAQVREWEDWAGEDVGPVARREAYRVAYNDPWHFTHNPAIRVAAAGAHRLILGVLKHYKARRFDASDAQAVPVVVDKVATALRKTGTGYLTTDHATAADHAVAALMRPLLYAEPGRDYARIPGWDEVVHHVERVKPKKVLRRRRRRIREKDWLALATATQRI